MAMIKATDKHQQVHKDFTDVLRKHQDLSALEMLALTSQLVGQLLALQDQRAMSKEQYLEVVIKNLENGNLGAVETFLGDVKGHG